MREWLDADAETILDEVMLAKEMTGECLDPGRPSAMRAALDEIRRAQADLRHEVRPAPDGRILVHRAIALDDAALSGLAPGDALGACWAFDPRGAHAYDAKPGRARYALTAWVDPGDVAWAMTLAMWGSGEGEARLDRRATLELVGIHEQGTGAAVRGDLEGERFGTSQPVGAGARPR